MYRRCVVWLGAIGVLCSMMFGASCVRIVLPTFPHQLELYLKGQPQPVQLTFYNVDQRVVSDFVALLRQSLSLITQLWGSLEEPVKIRVFPNHRSLEEAVNRSYVWLRAWAMYDQIYVQTPRTWHRRSLASLPKLLTHELTHVVMYQRCCSRHNWFRKQIPFWFREGMASVTAAQGSWRLSQRELSQLLKTPYGRKLWQAPVFFLQRKSDQRRAYSLAHWMFYYLLHWCSTERTGRYRRLESLLVGMKRQNLSFPGALHRACGFTLHAFRERFAKQMGMK